MTRLTHLKRLSFLIALLATFILPANVQAKLICRSDPVVILSNGVIMDIGASISTMPWEVQEVHYRLHVPRGVSMILAIHTPTWLTSQETFTVVADQDPNYYKVATVVRTMTGDATVSADATLVALLNVKLGIFSVTGPENTMLWLGFRDRH
jgi:hypothetical protein